MKLLMNLYRHLLIFGRSGFLVFWKIKNKSTNDIKISKVRTPISLRSGTSDIPLFYEIFWKNEYGFNLSFEPVNIIDAGANIGLAALFFANKYPNTKIISIEPEKSNFDLMLMNINDYPNIIPLRKGLSNLSNQKNEVYESDKGKWGFTTGLVSESLHQDDERIISTISIDDIMAMYNLAYLDIVKIDIEGAEKELFESNYENWLSKTRCLVIELHDRLKLGCSKNFFNAIGRYNFSLSQKGENLILINQDLL